MKDLVFAEPSFYPRVIGDTDACFPPGDYYVGDPCYAFGHDEIGRSAWKSFCEAMRRNDFHYGFHRFYYDAIRKANFVVGFSTYYGDGGWDDQFGNHYGVDSGTLGMVPKALVDEGCLGAASAIDAMTLVHFDKPFSVGCDISPDGFVRIGHVKINLGEVNDDEV